MIWISIIIVLMVIAYLSVIRPHAYWTLRGVKQCNPFQMIVNNMGTLLKKYAFAEMVEIVYNSVPDARRYLGMYQLNFASLVLKDPDLIKEIMVKNFDHFTNHRQFISANTEPLWRNNLFSLTGQKWREMRTILSPAFTSSKMKYMFHLISQNGEQFINYFLEKNENLLTIEMKDTFTRFTNDVIASTAFGVECDSLRDPNNEFFLMGINVTNLSGLWQTLKFLANFIFPKVFEILHIRLFPRKSSEFFINLVKENVELSRHHRIVRPNMINLLLQALKYENDDEKVPKSNYEKCRKDIKITEYDVASQAILFFFAGFDTVATLMCFMAYELGVNPNIQKQLIQEVDETGAACNGKITYEALFNMKYLNMVVSESMRKWPNGLVTERICTKPFIIEPKFSDERPVHLEKNDSVWLPIFAIHRDPNNYPEPEKFCPERFNETNKNMIKPYTYIPFGVGPRKCIGAKFAEMETKIVFFHILTHFEIISVKKTQIPLKLSKKGFIINAENGFWLGLQRRIK